MKEGSKNNRWWLLLILILSVLSIMRKFFKTTHTEERSVHKFRNLQYSTRILKNPFNSKQIIQILQPINIDFFRRIRIKLIFHNIFEIILYKKITCIKYFIILILTPKKFLYFSQISFFPKYGYNIICYHKWEIWFFIKSYATSKKVLLKSFCGVCCKKIYLSNVKGFSTSLAFWGLTEDKI